jgi:hypothetical protein
MAAGVPQPGDTHPIALAEPVLVRPRCDHPSNHLVPRHGAGSSRDEVALGKMEVGAAQPAGGDPENHLTGSRARTLPMNPDERT